MQPSKQAAVTDRLIRLPEVSRLTGLSRTSIYRAEAAAEFPKRRRVGLRAVAWSEAAVRRWMTERAEVQA